jgi:hypothetical protein
MATFARFGAGNDEKARNPWLETLGRGLRLKQRPVLGQALSSERCSLLRLLDHGFQKGRGRSRAKPTCQPLTLKQVDAAMRLLAFYPLFPLRRLCPYSGRRFAALAPGAR